MKVHFSHTYCVLLTERVNTRGNRYWSLETSTVLHDAPLHDPKAGVCCEIGFTPVITSLLVDTF
jgi:hypothetical protein